MSSSPALGTKPAEGLRASPSLPQEEGKGKKHVGSRAEETAGASLSHVPRSSQDGPEGTHTRMGGKSQACPVKG